MAVHYRVELNPLTKPASYRLRFIPQGTAGYDEVAARVALKNPGSSAEQIKNHLRSAMEEIQAMLLEGLQVTLEDAMTLPPSLSGRLRTPLTVAQLSHPHPPETGILTGSAAAGAGRAQRAG